LMEYTGIEIFTSAGSLMDQVSLGALVVKFLLDQIFLHNRTSCPGANVKNIFCL
jgi:hypothetical protein